MIKAYSVLAGKRGDEVTAILSGLIETGLSALIADELQIEMPTPVGSTSENEQVPPRPQAVRRAAPPRAAINEDTTGVSDGLGDEDDGSEDTQPDPAIVAGLKDMEALVPPSAGPSDNELDKDLDIEDPSSEAKAEGTFAEQIRDTRNLVPPAEDMFSSLAGLPKMPTEEEYDPYKAKRKKQSKSRAKISGLEAFPSDTQ
jgi:hypothetical protein